MTLFKLFVSVITKDTFNNCIREKHLAKNIIVFIKLFALDPSYPHNKNLKVLLKKIHSKYI